MRLLGLERHGVRTAGDAALAATVLAAPGSLLNGCQISWVACRYGGNEDQEEQEEEEGEEEARGKGGVRCDLVALAVATSGWHVSMQE